MYTLLFLLSNCNLKAIISKKSSQIMITDSLKFNKQGTGSVPVLKKTATNLLNKIPSISELVKDVER